MAFKKRRKSTRQRGRHSGFRGGKKKARGSGHRGGFGMSGTGKRGDQKKTLVLKLYGNDYFRKDRALRRGRVAAKPASMDLAKLALNMDNFVKQGLAKQSKDGYEIDLSNYKILGELNSKVKLTIKAFSASESAIESVKAAGGKISVVAGADEDGDEDLQETKVVKKVEQKK